MSGVETMPQGLDSRAATLSRWEIVQLARHPKRPRPLDFLRAWAPDYYELKGDRRFGDDQAIVGGLASFGNRSVMLIALARQGSAEEFLGAERPGELSTTPGERQGMVRPEGLRKAVRLARLADRLGLPIITLIDSPGAWPGADSEDRGLALAIAECLESFAAVKTVVLGCVLGEGGSGGGLALSVCDRLLMLEFAAFAVISPEACSSILFRSGENAPQSAEALQPSAHDLHRLGLVDQVVAEPPGGAHRSPEQATQLMATAVKEALDELSELPEEQRLTARYRRFRAYGELALRT